MIWNVHTFHDKLYIFDWHDGLKLKADKSSKGLW